MKEKKVWFKIKVNNRIPRSLIGLCPSSYESAGIKKSSHLTPRIRQRKSARTEATVLTPKFLKISITVSYKKSIFCALFDVFFK